MPSNNEYINQAVELAAELGLEVSTDGLNNEKLAALVSDLKAKKKDADNVTGADKAEAEAEAEAEAANPPFYIKPGKSLTTKRGILATERDAKDGSYTEIKVGDLAGGKDALSAFVKSGHVGKS